MDKPARILIVDDEPALLLGLASTIKRHGYDVITATNGSEGLEKIGQTMPDLVLSDVMMPPPNGFEMRSILCKDPKLGTIPFIFLTARSDVQDRILGLNIGADDYITKPFETEELFARIEAVLRRVGMEQERGRQEMKVIADRDMERLKQEILQNFHHELHTPLTNILLPLKLVVSKRFVDPEEQTRFVHIALSNADKLESLVTDLTLLHGIDNQKLNAIRQGIDVRNNIVVPIQKRYERYKDKNLSLHFTCPQDAVIYAPRREFSHSLVHLADNAFKFCHPNGHVSIRVEAGGDGGATITVWNDGPGISPDLREKVFERFYQISQGDCREYDGLGVGLTITRAVFEGLGGSVNIVDSITGTRIQAILPDRRPGDIIYG